MKKWFIKNKDIILINISTGIFLLIIAKFLDVFLSALLKNQNMLLNIFSRVMKFSISIPIFYIVLFIIFIPFISRAYNSIKNRNKKLKIISAKYFTDDSHSIDITDELNNNIEKDKIKIVLSNKIAGDPHKGMEKKGKIKYKINGIETEKDYKENETVELP